METYGLSLKEILYLLSVKEKDGRSNINHMSFGLIGACLFELVDHERIAIEEKRLKINNQKPTGDPALDFVLEKLSNTRKNKKIKTWVSSLNNKAHKIRKPIRDMLYQKHYLGQEDKKFLFIPYQLHPVIKTKEKEAIASHLRKSILQKKDFEDLEANLIAMAMVSGAFRNIFSDRKERRQAKKKVKTLIKDGAISSSVSQSIQEMQAAIMAAVVASTAASTAAAGSN